MTEINANVAVVICNWNKKEYVINCIKSVLDQDYREIDIFVVDNASADGSPEAVEKEFGCRVRLLVNAENLGGSGGFNTGIREALKGDYSYIWLLDNDVVVDKSALGELVTFMEANENAGMAGSKLYFMTQPGLVQEFGAWIDWDRAHVKPNKKYYSEAKDGVLTGIAEVDYVPACSVLVRADAIRQCGLMDETNFIYWDDMEWGFRFNRHGYKVYAVASSRVWHNMGTANKKNLLPTYYFWRNRIRFFKKYGDRDVLNTLINDLFTALFTCRVFDKDNTYNILMKAMIDGFNDTGGPVSLEPGRDISVDVPKDYLTSCSEEEKSRLEYKKVGHVILDAMKADKNNRRLIYTDNYNNVLPADLANSFLKEHEEEKERFINENRERFYG